MCAFGNGTERQARVRALLERGFETDRLTTPVVYYKIVPLLHWHLKGFAHEVDGRFPLDWLRAAIEHNARRVLWLTGDCRPDPTGLAVGRSGSSDRRNAIFWARPIAGGLRRTWHGHCRE